MLLGQFSLIFRAEKRPAVIYVFKLEWPRPIFMQKYIRYMPVTRNNFQVSVIFFVKFQKKLRKNVSKLMVRFWNVEVSACDLLN